MTVVSSVSWSEFRQLIDEAFSLDEIGLLCFDLGIDYDHLPAREKRGKIAELIRYCHRSDRLTALIERLREERPQVAWLDASAFLYERAQDMQTMRGLVEENLRGIGELPTNYETRIRNFLLYYLGTEKEPVPFGGREADFERLERWRGQSDKPFLLLAAPAGRGKSALLVRWSQALLERPEWRDGSCITEDNREK